MAFPRSRHMSNRLNNRLGRRGGRGGLLYLLAGVAAGSMFVYGVARRKYGPGSFIEADSQVLTIDLTSPPPELNTPSLLQPVQRPSHLDTLRVLDYASKDKSVRGLMAKVGSGGEWNLAQAQEIRQASQSDSRRASDCTCCALMDSGSSHSLNAAVSCCAGQSSASHSRASSLTPSQRHSVSQPSGGISLTARCYTHTPVTSPTHAGHSAPTACWLAGEFSDSNTSYYLASAFDKIYLQPCGDLNLLGYKVNSPFLRSLFDRLGILPQFVQRKEYKNAPNVSPHPLAVALLSACPLPPGC